ncbi:hypothetical protein AURANDRAFT_63746 [Aureococcus anophagefferens]|uniref:Uncharacterized protein n=1 Tax=Aureococcus anophagefferens TaxID=44056 RepID=F0Y8R5_AURAN|nr:hypothetical protein AURANDRAFT_63746 [Aureococcus anophagefferens]EGB08862.1 hypothetical protein AURANDRAFT_63746 [Aureococcus anophagefferens]|eukprot:XP_009036838.1 hypothetical protein AURANDRAFT_63746 [Aureococcus anophagefferens]
MLAELRETAIRRLGELLDAAPDVADQIAALERAGVAPEKLFAAALKRRGAAPAARPPALDGSWAAALRTGRVAASLHSLVVDNGAVYGFGFDPLGAPRRGARHAPRALPGLAGRAVSAAAGWGFSLALTDDGAVHGGGRGFSPGSLAAVAGLGAVRVAMVAAGAAHALCLDDAGRVWSLGCGDDGRLGRGPDRDPAPAVVCRALAATAGGRVYSWGHAGAGRLGRGPPAWPEEPAPKPVAVAVAVAAVAAGKYHSLAVAADGSLYAFGDNSYGQLGLGGDDDAFEPARVDLPAGAVVVAAAAGGSHSVVLLEGGDVLGFGSNADGQLGELEDVEDVESDGDGEDDGDSDGADGEDGASSGDDASDASDDSDGSDETAAEVWTPTRIAGLCGRGVVEVAAGGDATGDAGHTLAVTKAGAVFALGAGQHGQLGAGLPRAATPVPVAIPAAAAPPRARRGQAWAAKRKTKSKQ